MNRQKKTYALASGKGGVGKTVLAASLGVGLASLGSEVILVDADLGGANLHTCMGILEPKYTFFDFYTLQREKLSDILLDTPVHRLRLISGACGTLGIANPKYFQKQRFMRELKQLRADYIILDLSAGANYNVIDFFLLADEQVVIVSPEPTSVHEAFNFIKVSLFRALHRALKPFPDALPILMQEKVNRPGYIHRSVQDLFEEISARDSQAAAAFECVVKHYRPKLVLNMMKGRGDVKEGLAIQAAARELLSLNVDYLGCIPFDPAVSDSVRRLTPFLLHNPRSRASQELAALIRVKLLGKKGFRELLERRRWRREMEQVGADYPSNDLYKYAPLCSRQCFYWGSCDYQDEGNRCKVRHLEPSLRCDSPG